jgi:hypothetical protein
LITLSAVAPNARKALVEVIRPTRRHVVLAAVLAGLPCAVTAEAIGTSRLLVIDAEGLHTLLREDTALADGWLAAPFPWWSWERFIPDIDPSLYDLSGNRMLSIGAILVTAGLVSPCLASAGAPRRANQASGNGRAAENGDFHQSWL